MIHEMVEVSLIENKMRENLIKMISIHRRPTNAPCKKSDTGHFEGSPRIQG